MYTEVITVERLTQIKEDYGQEALDILLEISRSNVKADKARLEESTSTLSKLIACMENV